MVEGGRIGVPPSIRKESWRRLKLKVISICQNGKVVCLNRKEEPFYLKGHTGRGSSSCAQVDKVREGTTTSNVS